ncbi:hypothetical protein Slin15195_G053210 [Septoria linicola]|uniref:Uncharacterized protein n=1 Tax=Septoria linicola TaxID=215465 RepID=A0A9Q9AU25_9PEZI|nr:hypothetical protein Slin14017_G124000 [Septoria linicola]USW52002.1 hypothetical protein Slin15195_G053210 [Septoria linicola]
MLIVLSKRVIGFIIFATAARVKSATSDLTFDWNGSHQASFNVDSPKSLQPVTLPPTTDRTNKLRTSCHAFCKALETPPPPEEILEKHFISSPKITEHGPEWARSRLPFVAKTYSGADEFLEYFSTLSKVLSMKMDPAPAPGEFAVQIHSFDHDEKPVDEGQEPSNRRGSGFVFVQGGGKFSSVEPGKSWNEKFVYRFSEFDQAGKIGHWE